MDLTVEFDLIVWVLINDQNPYIWTCENDDQRTFSNQLTKPNSQP